MSEDVRDPFADKVEAHDGKKETLDEKMNHVHSIPPPINFERVIQRLAEIEDELARRGIQELIEEKEKLRDAIKSAMVQAGTKQKYDEVSNFEAILVPRFKDVWNVDALRKVLTEAQRLRYIVEIVDETGVKAGIKTGDLSRGELEAKNAVVRTPTNLALYVSERSDETDG